MVPRGDSLPSHSGTRLSSKTDIVMDTRDHPQHDGMLNVFPAIDSHRAAFIFNTQTLTPKLKPSKLPATRDGDEDSPALKPQQEESKKKRVDEEYRKAKYARGKSVAEKRHMLRVEGLPNEREKNGPFSGPMDGMMVRKGKDVRRRGRKEDIITGRQRPIGGKKTKRRNVRTILRRREAKHHQSSRGDGGISWRK